VYKTRYSAAVLVVLLGGAFAYAVSTVRAHVVNANTATLTAAGGKPYMVDALFNARLRHPDWVGRVALVRGLLVGGTGY